MERIQAHLAKEQIEIVEGPVKKSGATGEICSVYLLDPDQNLIEISVYPDKPASL
jgi:extradiol dioxygenase family protein